MAFPVIQYDAAAGSDTAASGAGPSTAITGASATAGAGNVINLDGSPDLSGVASDGSAAIWVNGATGAHLAKITAVDDTGKTVTTEILMVTAGVSWAIGGERASMVNDTGRFDWEDALSGWTFEFDSGTYLSGDTSMFTGQAIGDATDGPFSFIAKSSLSAGRPKIHKPSTDAINRLIHFSGSEIVDIYIEGVEFAQDVAWGGGSAIRTASTNSRITVVDVLFTSANTNVYSESNWATAIESTGSSAVLVYNSAFSGNWRAAMTWGSGRNNKIFQGNFCNGCGIVMLASSSFSSCAISENIFINSKTYGISLTLEASTSFAFVNHNIVVGAASHGIFINSDAGAVSSYSITNNILADNGGYGISSTSGGGDPTLRRYINWNAFHANVSGDANVGNTIIQDDNILAATLTVDPFTNAAGGDFSINDMASGGALLRGTALARFTQAASTEGFPTIGAVQLAAGGGGGVASILGPNLKGGLI